MAHSYVSALFHCAFSTKERRRTITPELQDRLWPYMGGIARENNMKALAISGVEDHVHIVLSLPSTMAVAKALQLIKGGSSKWVHEQFPAHRSFAWQEGYGAFSIGVAQLEETKRYIAQHAFTCSHSLQPRQPPGGGTYPSDGKTRGGAVGRTTRLVAPHSARMP